MAVAARYDAEILSVDSMQVYRGMDIGTAKPDADARRRIPHHLIDLADPADEVTVADFRSAGRTVLDRLATTATPALITGGSGLHLRALVDPMTMAPTDPDLRTRLEATPPVDLAARLVAADPTAGDHIDLANPRRVLRAVEILELTGVTPTRRAGSDEYRALRDYRPERPFIGIGVDPGDTLAERATRRFDAMIEAGLVDEVTRLAPRLGRNARQAVGYKELLAVVSGNQPLAEARLAAIRSTVALARRQRTFFRRDPRIQWISWGNEISVRLARIGEILDREPSWSS